MKALLTKLIHFSLVDWGRILLPFVAYLFLHSLYREATQRSHTSFWEGIIHLIPLYVWGALILLISTLILTVGLKIKVGPRLVEHWQIPVFWGFGMLICGIVSVILNDISYSIGETFWDKWNQYLENLIRIKDVNWIIFFAIDIFFGVIFWEAFCHLTNYYQTVIKIFNQPRVSLVQEPLVPSPIPPPVLPLPTLQEAAPESTHDGFGEMFEINEKEFSKKIVINSISYIEIKDQCRTVAFQEEGKWNYCGSYGSLKEIEERFPNQFFKINRSVLVNPTKIQRIEKIKRQYYITMHGRNSPFQVSRSLNKSIQTLLTTHDRGEVSSNPFDPKNKSSIRFG